jgi:hypothetical protein
MTPDTPTPTPTDDVAAPMASTSPHRRRGAVLAAALLLTAVAASAAASAALSEEAPVPLEGEMQAEIDAMLDSGIAPDDPKVEMLEEQLAELEAGADADPPPEPGVDVEALLEEAQADEAAEDAGVATRSSGPAGSAAADATAGRGGDDGDEPAWESGTVQCEVIPGLLGADEIAGARCVSVPQPDGTSQYAAIGADGSVRTVAFGHDGRVQRLDDVAIGAPLAPGTATAATPEGDLVVTPPGQAAHTVDLG